MISSSATPLPEIKILSKALIFSQNFKNLWAQDKNIYLYSRGMWALASGIQALLRKKGKKEGTVWFPDYFCNEALLPMRQSPSKLDFYPIGKNLEPSWDILEKKVRILKPPDIFVLVHYFGFPNNLKKVREFCEKYEIELIEDGAHVLLPSCGIGEGENPVIYSPRKVLALPEGGILVFPEEIEPYIERQEVVVINKTVIIWFIKRFAQKIMVKLEIPWHKVWKIRGNQYSNAKWLNSLPSPNYSIITYKLLCAVEKEIEEVVQKRKKNYNLLVNELVDNNITPLFPHLLDCVCPYAFPVLVKEGRDLILEKLQKKGILANSWPDIPPEVSVNREKHKATIWLQRHIMLFPIHQSLSKRQMEYMVETYREVVSGKR